MDATEIARLRGRTAQGKDLQPFQVMALIDALEQAQKERDEWQAAVIDWTGPGATKALLAERDQAQKDAKDARALLMEDNEAFAQIHAFTGEHGGASKAIRLCLARRARIEAMLEKKRTRTDDEVGRLK